MSWDYTLHELAQKDYENAVEWYATKSIKLANDLIGEIEHSLKLISENPNRWRQEHENFRELKINKFPYQIVYLVDEYEKHVLIVAVFHTSNDPKRKYRKRL